MDLYSTLEKAYRKVKDTLMKINYQPLKNAMHKVVSAKKQNLFDLNKKAVQLGYDYEG